MAVPLADAKIEPAAGEEIEGRSLLGEQHRVVPGEDDHGGPQAQGPGARGERRLQHERSGDLVPAGEVMLDQEAGMIAQCLGLDRLLEIIVEALPGFGPEIVAVGLGRA